MLTSLHSSWLAARNILITDKLSAKVRIFKNRITHPRPSWCNSNIPYERANYRKMHVHDNSHTITLCFEENASNNNYHSDFIVLNRFAISVCVDTWMQQSIEARGGKLPIKWMAIETLKQNEYTVHRMCMCVYLWIYMLLNLVGHSVFCYTNYSQWATHHIRQFNRPIWLNIWKAENDCRNPNHYVLRKCISFDTTNNFSDMEVLQIWLDAVVLECGRKWTTEIWRHSSSVGNNYVKDILQLRLLFAIYFWA